MPKVTVDAKQVEAAADRRLVLAIQDMGIHIGHRCGGKARCTTCRVAFVAGEPKTMTEAEYLKLEEKGLLGRYRLSCQILCEHDMTVVPQLTRESEGWPDTGPEPAETVEPEARWYPVDELRARRG